MTPRSGCATGCASCAASPAARHARLGRGRAPAAAARAAQGRADRRGDLALRRAGAARRPAVHARLRRAAARRLGRAARRPRPRRRRGARHRARLARRPDGRPDRAPEGPRHEGAGRTGNFGMAYPEGYRKAMRVMGLADRHGFPLVTLVDTPGAYPGVAAEQHGQGGAIARSQAVMARLGVPTVACVIGEGGSGGAVALAVADRVLMQEHAIYSVISPGGLRRDPLARRGRGAEGGGGVQAGRGPLPRAGRDRRDRPGAARAARRPTTTRPPVSSARRSARRSTSSRDSPADELRRAPAGEVPLDGRLATLRAVTTLSTGFSPRTELACSTGESTAIRAWSAGLPPTSSACREAGTASLTDDVPAQARPKATRPRKARSAKTPEPFGGRKRAANGRSSSSSGTTPAGSTTTSGSSGTARSPAGPCRRACRSSRASGARRPRRGPSARLRDVRGGDPGRQVRRRHGRDLGLVAPTSSSRRSATAA